MIEVVLRPIRSIVNLVVLVTSPLWILPLVILAFLIFIVSLWFNSTEGKGEKWIWQREKESNKIPDIDFSKPPSPPCDA